MKVTSYFILKIIGASGLYFLCFHWILLHHIFGVDQTYYLNELEYWTNEYNLNVSALFAFVGVSILFGIIDILSYREDSKLWFEFDVPIPTFNKSDKDREIERLYTKAGKAFAEGDDDLGNKYLDKIEKLKEL